ncbi:MAG: lysine--tRNA ligase [Candidatus Omnitrophica bacterium]|nr:lysine--tRNA ligase [Candidatus Omnitrophota bacterium]
MKHKECAYGGRFLPMESIETLRKEFKEGRQVKIAGRLMSRRIMGKSTFSDLKDQNGRIQIYAKKDVLGEELYHVFTSLNIGDILGIEGILFTSKTGEPTVRIENFKVLSTIVRTLPEKWHGLKDIETRYRHRYVDLIVNDDVRKIFKKRSDIIRGIRQFLDDRGFMEVETPMMQPIPGGARAKPFVTHHNALHTDLYLRVAPELYLKRLLVGGFEKVYEINRNFRNEGVSVRHNPEFTMLEVYQAYADYTDMMEITEELISGLVKECYGKEEIPFGDKTLNFKRPWKRISFYDAIQEKTGIDFRKIKIREGAKKLKIERLSELNEMEEVDILNEIFDEVLQDELWHPTFVIDYPTVMTPLAKAKEEDPDLVYRFELFIAKMELANAFSELNDPMIQRERLTVQKEMIGEHKVIDEDFLMALEYGMPSAGGLGIGIDRLVMLLTNQHSIREVILFPQLKPEKPVADLDGDDDEGKK